MNSSKDSSVYSIYSTKKFLVTDIEVFQSANFTLENNFSNLFFEGFSVYSNRSVMSASLSLHKPNKSFVTVPSSITLYGKTYETGDFLVVNTGNQSTFELTSSINEVSTLSTYLKITTSRSTDSLARCV